MDIAAKKFDEPVDSPTHSDLRNTAWMGGDLVEGRYLLGMLVGKNLFCVPNEDYVRELHRYLSTKVSALAGEVYGNLHRCQHAIPYLRYMYRTETDYPTMPRQDVREESAIAYLLHHPNATDAEIASDLGTTEKQIQRVTAIAAARKELRLYRESEE